MRQPRLIGNWVAFFVQRHQRASILYQEGVDPKDISLKTIAKGYSSMTSFQHKGIFECVWVIPVY